MGTSLLTQLDDRLAETYAAARQRGSTPTNAILACYFRAPREVVDVLGVREHLDSLGIPASAAAPYIAKAATELGPDFDAVCGYVPG